MCSLFGRIWGFMQAISVEPMILLLHTATAIYSMSSDLGMYRIMCDQFFNANGGTELNNHSQFECWDTSTALGEGLGQNETAWWSEAETILQQRSTQFAMIGVICGLVPSVLMDMVLGAYADRHGRKGVLLLSYFGFCMMVFAEPFLYMAPKTAPVWVIYIVNVVASLTGTVPGATSASAAYLSDTVDDREMLTVRTTILQMCMTTGVIIGPVISNAVSRRFGFVWSFITALAMAAVSFICSFFLVKLVKPRHHREPTDGSAVAVIGDNADCEKEEGHKPVLPEKVDQGALESVEPSGKVGCCRELVDIAKSIPGLLVDCWRTVSKRREGRRRGYILVCTYFIFVYSVADMLLINTVFTLYAQKQPIGWGQDQLSTYRSLSNAIRLVATTLGIILFKKCLHLSNTFIILVAFASITAQTVLVTLATASWLLYVAAAVGMLGALQFPCTQAFVAEIVDPDEVGKVYAALALAQSLGMLFSFDVFGAIYQVTVAVFPTMCFLVSSAMLASALLLSVWLHFDNTASSIGRLLKKTCACCREKKDYAF